MPALKQDKNSTSNDNSGYAMLAIDDLKLLIPQQQIKSLEMSSDMDSSESSDTVAGYLEFENKLAAVFCLDGNLTILNLAPPSRQVCILLQAADNELFGILCDRAELLDDGVIHPQPFPECMLVTDSPLQSLAIFNDEISSITSAELLAKLLPIKQSSKNTGVADYV